MKYPIVTVTVWAIFSAAAVASATDEKATDPETKSPDQTADSEAAAPPPKEADESASEASGPEGAAEPGPETEASAPLDADDEMKMPCTEGEAPDGTVCPPDPSRRAPEGGPEQDGTDGKPTETAEKPPEPPPEKPPEKEIEAAVSGPSDQGPPLSLYPAPALSMDAFQEFDHRYKRNRIMQTTGYSMLGVSLAMEVIGVVFTLVAPRDALGWSGFGIIGGGLLHYIIGAVLVGFSEPPGLPPSPGRAHHSSGTVIVF